MLTLSWVKCGDDHHWCSFENVDLSNINTIGVYIIWHSGNPARVVRIGQGDIADRLSEHQDDYRINQYSQNGPLYVTWASVAYENLDGVEKYLSDTWSPLVGERFPDAVPIVVNSPWE